MIIEFENESKSSPKTKESDEHQYLFDDRSRMISSKKLISETAPSPESICDFIKIGITIRILIMTANLFF